MFRELTVFMIRFTLRRLLVVVTLICVVLGLLGSELIQARYEQAAYRDLVRRGAIGDDWIGWKEIFLGREYAPIKQIHLPKTLTIREALPLLRQLDNLKSLEISCSSIDVQELESLHDINWIDSLTLYSVAISDDSVSLLSKFDHLRWMYLDGTQISDSGARQLTVELPNCRIQR